MKKNYVLLFASCLFAFTVNTASAQSPTITSANLPHVGSTYNQVNDSNHIDKPTFTVTAGSGTAQTWNYASKFVTTYTSSSTFVTPSSLTGSSSFPGSNLAESTGTGTATTNVFFTSSASGLVLNGAYVTSSSLSVVYVPNAMEIPTPFTYPNTSTTTYSYAISGAAGTYSYTQRQHSTRTITADAFGSLTTPAGTYPNTLRLKSVEVDVDSSFGGVTMPLAFTSASTATTTTYNWFESSSPFLLMTISMNGTGAVTSAAYTQSAASGIESHTSPFETLSLYPNPAVDAASLSYENKNAMHVTIEMYDISGRFIATLANENQTAGKQILPIDAKALGLNSGLYFVRISGLNGSETMKLSIN